MKSTLTRGESRCVVLVGGRSEQLKEDQRVKQKGKQSKRQLEMLAGHTTAPTLDFDLYP